MSERLSLALPVDVSRLFDTTVTQAQIDADTFINAGDDPDQLAAMIEDAEDEFRQQTDQEMRVSRVGSPDARETFEEVTYNLSGHKAYRRSFSHHTFDYDYEEVTVHLGNSRVLPFDTAEDDAVYVYRGLGGSSGSSWDEISDDEGDIWEIINHRDGLLAIHPRELHRALTGRFGGLPAGRERLQQLRFAISYRYGGLGGSRGQASQTTLTQSVGGSESDTPTVTVADGSRFPTGSGPGTIIVLIGREYIEANPDPANDQLDIVTRAVRGTTVESHADGDRIQYTPPAVRKAVTARAAMQLVQSNRYRSWLPDSEDDLDSSDVMSELGAIWSGTVDAMS